MSKDINFSQGTVVPSSYLNQDQEGDTGAAWGIALAYHTATTVSLKIAGFDSQAALVIGGKKRWTTSLVNSPAATGAAGSRNLYANTTTNSTTFTLELATGASSSTLNRKIGTAYWSGSALTQIKLTHGVQADADQFNLFTFRSASTAAGESPVTIAAWDEQANDSTDLLVIGAGTANITPRLAVTATGRTTFTGVNSSSEFLRAQVSADAQYRWVVDVTGKQSFSDGSAVADAFVRRSAANTILIDNTLSVATITHSGASIAIAKDLDLASGKVVKYNGTALSAALLTDAADLARLSGTQAFTGVKSFTAASTFTGHVTLDTAAGTPTRLKGNAAAGADNLIFDSTSTMATTGNLAVFHNAGTAKLKVRHDGALIFLDTTVQSTAFVPADYVNVASPQTISGVKTISATGKSALIFDDTTTTTGFTIGADTNLFRLSAGNLKTDSNFIVAGTLNVTGIPTIPTAAVDTNTTQAASTAYVIGQLYLKAATAAATYAPLVSPTLTGVPLAPTAAVDTNTTQLATTAYVIGQLYLKAATAASTYAPLASPTFSGTPTLPTGTIATTQAPGNSTTAVATTAFVTTANNLKADLASPTFTGTPSLPTGTTAVTQSGLDNSTKLATTEYVDSAVTGGGAADASTSVKGITRLSVAPVSAAIPIAVGTNDTRVVDGQAAGTASIRQLGTGATHAAAGNDARLSDSRGPNGSAGGDLVGSTYPNPTIAPLAVTTGKIALLAVTDAQVAAANKDGAAGTASMRTLGTGAAQAAAGNDQRFTNATYAAVEVVATSNIVTQTLTSTYDGVSMANGNRVLLTAQTDTTKNGIYIYVNNATPMVRATDMDASAECLSGATVSVRAGTLGASTLWHLATTGSITLETTPLTFKQVGGLSYESNPAMDGAAAAGTSPKWAHGDHVHPSDTTKASTNSPTLTTPVLAADPARSTNTTAIASTAYVKGQHTSGTADRNVVSAATAGAGATYTNTALNATYISDGAAWTRITPQAGEMVAFPGLTLPPGLLRANGQTVSRATYPEVFASLTRTQNGTCSTSSAVITGLSDTSGLFNYNASTGAKCHVEGTSIGVGYYVVTVDSASQVTLSSGVGITAGTRSITFLPNGQGDGSTTFNVADTRGRTLLGRNTMNNAASGRIVVDGAYVSSLDGVGSAGGEQKHTLLNSGSGGVNESGHGYHGHNSITASGGIDHYHGVSGSTGYSNQSLSHTHTTHGVSASGGTWDISSGGGSRQIAALGYTSAAADLTNHTHSFSVNSGYSSGYLHQHSITSTEANATTAHNNMPNYLMTDWCVRA